MVSGSNVRMGMMSRQRYCWLGQCPIVAHCCGIPPCRNETHCEVLLQGPFNTMVQELVAWQHDIRFAIIMQQSLSCK